MYGVINNASPVGLIVGTWDIMLTRQGVVFLQMSEGTHLGVGAGLGRVVGDALDRGEAKRSGEDAKGQAVNLDRLLALNKDNFAVPKHKIERRKARGSFGDSYVLFRFTDKYGPRKKGKIDFNFPYKQLKMVKGLIEKLGLK